MFNLGIRKSQHDEIVSTLIEENYLNEERYAVAFAGGKWRMKHWGRVKIKYELKQRQVSDYSIKKAMKQIEEEEYLLKLQKIAEERFASLKSEQWIVRKKKTIDYLILRGFEHEFINQVVAGFKQ